MRFLKTVVFIMSLVLLGGCSKSDRNSPETPDAGPINKETAVKQTDRITFTDDLGYEIEMDAPKKTAVLSGSLTDAWLLAGGEAAAATEDAKDILENAGNWVSLGTLKTPGVETMIAEEIDFVILSGAIAEHVRLRETLENAGITTAYFIVETFEDYAAMMKILTGITGRKDLYQSNAEALSAEIETQIARADESRPSVLFLRAYSTGVKAQGSDSMTGRMLQDLGCVNIADREGSLLEDLSMEAIIAADPDYIFVTTMGESQEDALAMVDGLLISNPAWSGLTAVKENRYYVLPKELFHIKPNKRWGESYRILADYLYGEE